MAWNQKNPYELTGYPALVFLELRDWGKHDPGHMDRLVGIQKIYSHLRAKVPLLVTKENDDSAKIQKLLDDIDEGIKDAVTTYDPIFEDENTYPKGEVTFVAALFSLYAKLDEVVALSHLIDNQRITSSPVPGADE